MPNCAKSGDRCAAIRLYAHCVEALRDELEPEPETVVLGQMIRTGQILGGVRGQLAATNRGGGSVGSPSELAMVPGSRGVAAGRSRKA